MNVEEKKRKEKKKKKSHSKFEGLKGGPFKHTKTFFFCKIFLIFHKNTFGTNSKLFFHKDRQVLKK